MSCTGVLLMAYGSPESLDDLEAYYTHIRGGRRPPPELVRELRERYEAIGGASPLNAVTFRQASALERRLNGLPGTDGDGPSGEGPRDARREGRRPDAGEAAAGRRVRGPYRVYVGMRHWRPWIADAMEQMAADGVTRAVGLALAPHYSRMSVEAYIEAAEQARRRLDSAAPSLVYVRSWCDHPPFVAAVARRLAAALEAPGFACAHVLFSAHSLPERVRSWDDPYPRELEATCRAVARALKLPDGRFSFAYQSQGRTPEPWLGPTLEEALRRLAKQGIRQVVVCPVGFVADHLEVLYDIDIEAKQAAARLGIELMRTESLNDAPDFIDALASLVRAALGPDGDPAPRQGIEHAG